MFKKLTTTAFAWWRSDAARVTGVALTVVGVAVETAGVAVMPAPIAHIAGQTLIAIGALHITPPAVKGPH
jgi:hypothetical protein